ncbi:hypothetical protein CCACVL1_23673 [Corchorus capsularis]|uniref:Protein kinase domain-containing protein n=1 Tax=Corchorus capsularis TaxID=210143 RepID=A0A1R3GSV9_COCAP|nr:hypothetical protein CCACVL1_23673 [Corchorus capsularis]
MQVTNYSWCDDEIRRHRLMEDRFKKVCDIEWKKREITEIESRLNVNNNQPEIAFPPLNSAHNRELRERKKTTDNNLPQVVVPLLNSAHNNKEPSKDFVVMILKGLVEIHSRGYVHSDLKPENILIFRQEDCSDLPILKIADFGLAKVIGVKDTDDDWEYGFRGTPPYMSPESILGEISGALDVWSLGCIVIEMLTGGMAWNYQGPEDLRDKLLWGKKPDIPEDMSTSGKDFVMKCFVRDPNERWSARMLLHHPFLQEKSTLGTKFSDSISPESQLVYRDIVRKNFKCMWKIFQIIRDIRRKAASLDEIKLSWIRRETQFKKKMCMINWVDLPHIRLTFILDKDALPIPP